MMRQGKWGTWVMLGSVLMMIVGSFKLITGITGLFNSQWLVQGYSGYYLVDITGLAIWWLVVGVVLMAGGLAALQGRTWGRIVGVVAAGLAAVSEFFMMPVYPVWSIVMIVIYGVTLYAFIVWKPSANN